MANRLKIRRALISASDKAGLVPLAQALVKAGAEIVATGNTARILRDAGVVVRPVEELSGSPEAFQGRMKTLAFPICSGILFRRGDQSDEKDLQALKIEPIDCVVVNFYPFEKKAKELGHKRSELVEEIDIGGPTLVRAAAKNAPDVLVLTDPALYPGVIQELELHQSVSHQKVQDCAALAWEKVLHYDAVIAKHFGARQRQDLRYGENPQQKAQLEWDLDSPLDWGNVLGSTALSYNNLLDVSSAYGLACDLVHLAQSRNTPGAGAVIIKHNNPCGVAWVNSKHELQRALELAWAGDPVSAFGSVIILTECPDAKTLQWLSERFIEVLAAPGLNQDLPGVGQFFAKRKNARLLAVRSWDQVPKEVLQVIPGGRLYQTTDLELDESLKSVTRVSFPQAQEELARFGIAVTRALKSNAVALVRELTTGSFQLVGAGQGQPNRIEALNWLAIPRALRVLEGEGASLSSCVLVSDAFFPFRDTVDAAAVAGIKYIVQPGGSMRDAESITACDDHEIAMAMTGVRHFRH